MEHQNIFEQADERIEVKKRPTAISVVCVLGFIGAVIAIPLIFSDAARHISSWYPLYLGFSAIIGFVCMVGLWKMKKWAAYTYAGLTGINQIILLAMGVWNIMALIIPATVVAIALSHSKKMD